MSSGAVTDRRRTRLFSRRSRSQSEPWPRNPIRAASKAVGDARANLTKRADVAISTSTPNAVLNPQRQERRQKTMVNSTVKPVASGGGTTVSIVLAEPNLFLTGFDHHGRRSGRRSEAGSAFLRGSLVIEVARPIKIKEINLRLCGKGRIDWSGSNVPLHHRRGGHESLQSLSQELKFFDVASNIWETEYGTACTYTSPKELTPPPVAHMRSASNSNHRMSILSTDSTSSGSTGGVSHLSGRDFKRMSLVSHSRSHSADRNAKATPGPEVHRDYKRFPVGVYTYTFEIPVDNRYCETVNLAAGSLNWRLSAEVVRPGPFKANICGFREVPIIRVPDQMSSELTEPIAIRKCWEDQLYYEMLLSGRMFPLGGRMSVAIKLQPLDKRVQVLKMRVYLSESVEYVSKYTDPATNAPVRRREPKRTMLIFEKVAGHKLDAARFPLNTISFRRGGEVSGEEHVARREAASLRGTLPSGYEATNHRHSVSNILGELDLGLEELWGDTEVELGVQIPTCRMMARQPEMQLHPDVMWTRFCVQHSVRVVLRVAKRDNVQPVTPKHQYEITIDSPITLLNCRNSDMFLPRYSSVDNAPDAQALQHQRECGCPDAMMARCPSPISVPGLSPKGTGAAVTVAAFPDEEIPPLEPAIDQPAAAPAAAPAVARSPAPLRPVPGSRAPSYRPRAFNELTIDTGLASLPPPPPCDDDIHEGNGLAMPPDYDVVVGTPSVDGLADYFLRLQSYNNTGSSDGASDSQTAGRRYDSDDSGDSHDGDMPVRLVHRNGRVNVRNPMSPVLLRAPSRSLDIHRPPLEAILGHGRGPVAPR